MVEVEADLAAAVAEAAEEAEAEAAEEVAASIPVLTAGGMNASSHGSHDGLVRTAEDARMDKARCHAPSLRHALRAAR